MSCKWCDYPMWWDNEKCEYENINSGSPIYYATDDAGHAGWWISGETGMCGTRIRFCPNCGKKLEV